MSAQNNPETSAPIAVFKYLAYKTLDSNCKHVRGIELLYTCITYWNVSLNAIPPGFYEWIILLGDNDAKFNCMLVGMIEFQCYLRTESAV
jgi:hypothetical protein